MQRTLPILLLAILFICGSRNNMFAQQTRKLQDLEKAWSVIRIDSSYQEQNEERRPRPDSGKYSTEIRIGNLPPQNSPDIRILPDTVPLNSTTQSENSVFISPLDDDVILNSNNSSTWPPPVTKYGASQFVSTSRGVNWTGSIQGAGGQNSGDPAVVIDRNGIFYVNYIAADLGQGVARSTDGGASWLHHQVASNPGDIADKNHMWVDNSPSSQYEGHLYVAWTDFGGVFDNQIVVSRSVNAGLDWSDRAAISTNIQAGSFNQGVNIQIGPNGNVYACWAVYDAWPASETAIGFAKSTNGGSSWQPATRIISNIKGIRDGEGEIPGGGLLGGKTMRTNSFPSMTVNQLNGNISIVWTNIGFPEINSGTERDNYTIRSTDGGATWSTPIRINQDTFGNGKDQWFPWIASDPSTGNLVVAFYDSRDFEFNNMVHTYVAFSTDDGQTWEDFRVSDESWSGDKLLGFSNSYAGDYISIAISNGRVYPVWSDDRETVAGSGESNMLAYTSPFCLLCVPVEVTQTLSTDPNPFGNFSRWENGAFASYAAPHSFDFPINSTEVLRGEQEIDSGEKYHRWLKGQTAESDLKNHHAFDIQDGFPGELTSKFHPTDPSITMKTDLLDVPGTTGGNVEFRDPWYIDSVDAAHGNNLMNRGMTDAIYHDRGSPFYPDFNTPPGEQSYNGVFLNENPNFLPDRPNYSVGAVNPNTIANLQSYFLGWEGDPSYVDYATAEKETTAVVFKLSGATAIAKYKAQFGSSSANATGLSSQRKILRDKYGYYHAAYESANHVWYSRSTNGGATWSLDLKVSTDDLVQPEYGMTHRNPSLSWQSHPVERILIVWETQRYEPEWSQNYVFANTINPLTMELDEEFPVADWIGIFPGINFSTMPSASNSYYFSAGANSILVVWYDAVQSAIMGRVKASNGTWGNETLLREGTVTALTMAPNAGVVDGQPWQIAWVESNILYYGTIPVSGDPVFNLVDVAASGGGNIFEPSLVNSGYYPGIAWYDDAQASGTSPLAGGSLPSIKYRERGPTGWTWPVTIWADTYGGVSSPNVTYNPAFQTVDVFWRGGMQVRLAQRTPGGWSGVTTVTTGVAPMASIAVPATLGGSTEILLSRGFGQVYPINRTPIIHGDIESPRANTVSTDSLVREGRGGTLSLPRGEVHVAIIQARFEGEELSYYRMNDTIATVRRVKFEEATTSTPFPGTGRIEFGLLYKGAGELPSNARFDIVVKDASTNQVVRTVRSFAGLQDTTISESISLDYLGRRVSLGISAVNFPNSTRYALERWFFGEDSLGASISKISTVSNVIGAAPQLPSTIALRPNYPNPFNPSTQFKFDLPEVSNVTLAIYDILGRQVAEPVKGEYEAGYHAVTWSASSFASGVYLARFTARQIEGGQATDAKGALRFSNTQKLVLTK